MITHKLNVEQDRMYLKKPTIAIVLLIIFNGFLITPALAQQPSTYDGNIMTSTPHVHIIPITLDVNDGTKLVYYDAVKTATQYWEQNLKKIDSKGNWAMTVDIGYKKTSGSNIYVYFHGCNDAGNGERGSTTTSLGKITSEKSVKMNIWTCMKNKQFAPRDVLRIATHELGHAIGLGHTSDPKAIMTPATIAGNAMGFTPQIGKALLALYGIRGF